jgi:type I restriction enzyme M protein
LNLQELKSHLWNCAEILRGSAVDRTDWKAYILPLLFFKRICDVWDEESAEATELYGEVAPIDFPEVHRFSVPEDCHWRDVRETPTNVGAALSHAMREIERANPDTLYRVFGAADWGNREMLTDEILKDLIEGLSAVPLGNNSVGSDILGDAYEYLIGRFADVTKRKKAGEFYTPRSVVRMMIDLLDPKEGESIYDPACGTGGMLLGAIEHVQRAGGDPRTFFGKTYGQEKNLTTSSIARMNLVLHGIEDFKIEREDTLRNPVFIDSSTGGLSTFDCVIANPPSRSRNGAAKSGRQTHGDGPHSACRPTATATLPGCSTWLRLWPRSLARWRLSFPRARSIGRARKVRSAKPFSNRTSLRRLSGSPRTSSTVRGLPAAS